jgi:hypothetical protein
VHDVDKSMAMPELCGASLHAATIAVACTGPYTCTISTPPYNRLLLVAFCRTDLPSPLSGFDGDMHGNNAATKLLQVSFPVTLMPTAYPAESPAVVCT